MHFTTRADLWHLAGPAERAFGPLRLQVTKLPELSEAVREANRPLDAVAKLNTQFHCGDFQLLCLRKA
jgi:hypothetical protein